MSHWAFSHYFKTSRGNQNFSKYVSNILFENVVKIRSTNRKCSRVNVAEMDHWLKESKILHIWCEISFAKFQVSKESCFSTFHSRHLAWAGWITFQCLLSILAGYSVNLSTSLRLYAQCLGDSCFTKVISAWFWKSESTGSKMWLPDWGQNAIQVIWTVCYVLPR